ncbi:hypothetical protein C8J57DRAFT_1397298 [Mycena rebaudengoi]|nr:hypothetical protein C8J57DRAFT_1397298 [Mycena rebaudengoi]
MPPQASSQPQNPLPHERPVLRRVGLLLHFGLLAILAVLLVVAANGHMERVIETPLDEFERVSNTISISLLVFITSYSVLLVLVTQQIALHRAVTSYQTLTAIHDITSSWSGLGAAIVSCWRQLAIPASVPGTGAVTVYFYLACIAMIHILFPTTIKLQLAEQSASAAGTMAYPNVTLVGDDIHYNWMTPNTLLPLLADLPPSQTPGLYNSTLYTVLDNWDGIGDVSVPAVSFNVSCGYLPNARTGGVVNAFLDNDPNPSPVNYTVVEATYVSQDTQYNFSYYSRPLDYRQIDSVIIDQGRGLGDNSASHPLGRSTLFYSSFTVTDSLGSQGSLLALPNTIASSSAERPRDLQVFGCSMSVHNHTVDIDTATRLPKVDVARKTSSKWEPWAPRLYDEHDIKPDGIPLAVQDIFIDGWTLTYYYAQAAPTLNPAGWSCWNYPSETGNVSYCGQIDLTNLLTQCDIEDRLELRERNLTDVALHELENTMGSMTAALYWGAQHRRYRQSDPQTMFVQGIRGTVDVTRTGAIGRLNINLISVVPCLAISLILLFLSYLMTSGQTGLKRPMDRTNLGTPAPKRSPIDTLGILQSFWLSQGSIRSELLQQLLNVVDPSVENLRRAGMFMVQLDGQPRSSGSDSELSLLSIPNHKYQNSR